MVKFRGVSKNRKEDPQEHPYVIVIHIHDYECQQSNQTRKTG